MKVPRISGVRIHGYPGMDVQGPDRTGFHVCTAMVRNVHKPLAMHTVDDSRPSALRILHALACAGLLLCVVPAWAQGDERISSPPERDLLTKACLDATLLNELLSTLDTLPQVSHDYALPPPEAMRYGIWFYPSEVQSPAPVSANELVAALEEALSMARALAEEEASRSRY